MTAMGLVGCGYSDDPQKDAGDTETGPLISFTRKAAEAGRIAGTQAIGAGKVWVFHSIKDHVVSANVGEALVDYYKAFMPAEQIRFVSDVEAAHGWPTDDAGGDCLEPSDDFINACGFDTAGELLNHLYGDLAPRMAVSESRELMQIDVSGYFDSGSSVADVAYLYMPADCRDAECRLHIAFHGCRQGTEFLEDRFVLNSGLNEWAHTNRIVVLYPQVESSLMNPQGCWDWWGYTGASYDQRNGAQISGINEIITAFVKHQLY